MASERERRYSAARKAELVLDVLTGYRTVGSACRQAGISEALYNEWQAEFLSYSARVFSKDEEVAAAEARIAELERLVGRLVLELEMGGAKRPVGGTGSYSAHNKNMSNGRRS